MINLEFWSDDRSFGLKIPKDQVSVILDSCQSACPNETGGILIGVYTKDLDCAEVKMVSKAPPDSRSGRTWFHRGVQGLQQLINGLWRKERQYYLGEWHFHPFGNPEPSDTDITQVQEIAESHKYNCPEPLLLIIGGDPATTWGAKAFVFRRAKSFIELKPCQ